ncbi:thermonuclease family protein [Microvirga arabica]|uniref:thermonuclease family protein n=1 Tax=Microvirga arabica TaxID=1128671 RepID=UPI001FE89123|nr:thermonuclease family protein [Microvirga arabica]
MRSAVLALALITLTSPVVAQSLSGQADVVDVDTIAIRGEKTRIRLYGVDGPESQQTCNDASGARYLCGSKAADALASIIGRSGRVSCKEQDRDRYGRIVATCEADGRDIGSELIRQGWAVEYIQYSDGRYSDEEKEAQRAKRGLWAGTFVKPWDWRRGERLPNEASTGSDRKCAIKGQHGHVRQ